MSNRFISLFATLCAALISAQASASLIPTTSTVTINPITHEATGQTGQIPQTATGQLGGTGSGPFIFTFIDAPLADANFDGTLVIHARGDYTLDAAGETVSVTLEDGAVFNDDLGASASNPEAHKIENQDDLVEWTQRFVLSGDDLFIWTQDHQLVITLNLSSAVDIDLYAGGLYDSYPPFVEATLTYTPVVVPLPATTWLFMTGLFGVLGLGRLKNIF